MRQLKDMLDLGTSTTFQHTNLLGTHIAKDEEYVKSSMSMLEGSCINPLKGEQQDLVYLSTGMLANLNFKSQSQIFILTR